MESIWAILSGCFKLIHCENDSWSTDPSDLYPLHLKTSLYFKAVQVQPYVLKMHSLVLGHGICGSKIFDSVIYSALLSYSPDRNISKISEILLLG